MWLERRALVALWVAAACLAGCDSRVEAVALDPATSVTGDATGSPSAKGIEIPCAQHTDARLAKMNDDGIQLASLAGLASGRYALPNTATPTTMVVMFHGHGNDSCSWRRHLQNVATKGAVAIAMDYTGQLQVPSENYGWCVRGGAKDSIAAAQFFLQKYPSITKVIAFAVSMGGNVAGYAVADATAKRAGGGPLFDSWVAIEGVHDLTQEYGIIRGIADVNADAKLAKAEIERENGGTIEQQPAAYREITNTLRASEMAYLKGVVLVHAQDDGLVPTAQSREMFSALNGMRVPTHLYSVALNKTGESDTTASSIVLGPVFGGAGQRYASPLAGHAWEGSSDHIVMKTGLDQLYALMAGGTVSAGETPVPGQ